MLNNTCKKLYTIKTFLSSNGFRFSIKRGPTTWNGNSNNNNLKSHSKVWARSELKWKFYFVHKLNWNARTNCTNVDAYFGRVVHSWSLVNRFGGNKIYFPKENSDRRYEIFQRMTKQIYWIASEGKSPVIGCINHVGPRAPRVFIFSLAQRTVRFLHWSVSGKKNHFSQLKVVSFYIALRLGP